MSAVQFRLWPPFFETHPVLVSFSLNKSQVSINFEQNDFIPANNQQMLSKNQIKSDIQVIELALNKAYIGSGYLPKENFQKLIFAINSLKASESLSAVDLCKEIEKSLSVAQDNHISSRLNKDRCS